MPSWTLTGGNDVFPTGGAGAPTFWTNTGADIVDGLGGDDIIDGGALNDILRGGAGRDEVFGGAGDDELVVYFNDSDHWEIYDGGDGIDTLWCVGGPLGTSTLPTVSITSTTTLANIEILKIDGPAEGASVALRYSHLLDPGGNGIALQIEDAVAGGADNLIVFGGEGPTLVDLSALVFVNWETQDHVRFIGRAVNETVIGTTVSDQLEGVGGADELHGGTGDDLLDGGDGADLMFGESGSDSYRVDNAADVVDESVAGSDGFDRVFSTIAVNLLDAARFKGDIEMVQLMFGASLDMTGNALNNFLIGNSGSNLIDGSAGADIMQGREGHDTYVVDNAGDVVDESLVGSSGIDTVNTTLTISLADAAHFKGDVENVTLLGTGNINATGNAFANTLVGNSGGNILNGLDGADTMRGMGGNDIYGVENVGDVVDESVAGSGGIDRVNSVVNISLVNASQVKGVIEAVVLLGTADIYAYGNSTANTLIGNSGSNVLGGGLGNDTLTGAGGNDFFLFNTALNLNNVDTITDMNEAGDDTIRLENAIFTALTTTGVLAAGAFRIGAAAADADDRIIYNNITGYLIYDTNGNAAGGAIGFAKLDTGLALTAADFVVV